MSEEEIDKKIQDLIDKSERMMSTSTEFIGTNIKVSMCDDDKKVLLDLITLCLDLNRNYKKEKEKNIFLEGYKVGAEETIKELKEKNKDLQKQLNGAFDRGFISKDKIKERMEQTKKVYDEEMKPYMIEVGNGEKVLNVTYLSKKEKEELINKRNCLLVQIKTYEMLLEEK